MTHQGKELLASITAVVFLLGLLTWSVINYRSSVREESGLLLSVEADKPRCFSCEEKTATHKSSASYMRSSHRSASSKGWSIWLCDECVGLRDNRDHVINDKNVVVDGDYAFISPLAEARLNVREAKEGIWLFGGMLSLLILAGVVTFIAYMKRLLR